MLDTMNIFMNHFSFSVFLALAYLSNKLNFPTLIPFETIRDTLVLVKNSNLALHFLILLSILILALSNFCQDRDCMFLDMYI